MKKFSPKDYQGKNRIYRKLSNHPNISKLWVWDGSQYEIPVRGKTYLARKYSKARKRLTEYFESLEEAKLWQSESTSVCQDSEQKINSSHMTISKKSVSFFDVVKEWQRRKYPTLAESTRDQYNKLLKLYFQSIMEVEIEKFTPRIVDEWIDCLINPEDGHVWKTTRESFDHELTLLATILKYYCEYHDETLLRYPIKRRHREAIQLKKTAKIKAKDFSEEEFLKFREQLLTIKRGEVLYKMATLQYYQALRVSEVAAIHWEDIRLDFNIPPNSRVKITKSIFWSRTKKIGPTIVNGFKNAKANQGTKEQPLMPASFGILKSLYELNKKGLVFTDSDGSILRYKNIKSAYDRAFKLAGLPYTATHVLRHGMTRKVYNDTGDLAVAGQLLGNTTQDSIQVYAKRSTNALNEYTQTQWDKFNELVAIGRK